MADNQNKLGALRGTDLLASVSDDLDTSGEGTGERRISRGGVPVTDSIQASDVVSINGNLISPSDSVQVSDAVTNNQYTPPYQVYFTSTTPASPPLNINLSVVSFSS